VKSIKLAILLIGMACTTPAHADTVVRKGGEWRLVIGGLSPEPKTVEICMAATTPEQSIAKLAAGKTCSKKDLSYNGNVVTFDLACNDGEIQGTTTMKGENVLKTDFVLKSGTGSSAKSVHSTIDSTWLGPCKPGETPH
jgi:hypothetical protein